MGGFCVHDAPSFCTVQLIESASDGELKGGGKCRRLSVRLNWLKAGELRFV